MEHRHIIGCFSQNQLPQHGNAISYISGNSTPTLSQPPTTATAISAPFQALSYPEQGHNEVPQSTIQTPYVPPHHAGSQAPPSSIRNSLRNKPASLSTTLWEEENTQVYQFEVNGVILTRRSDNSMVNGTKLLNVAHLTRGRRDGILKNERPRVVVKNGLMNLKGVWISLRRARSLAGQFEINDLCAPILADNPVDFLYKDYQVQDLLKSYTALSPAYIPNHHPPRSNGVQHQHQHQHQHQYPQQPQQYYHRQDLYQEGLLDCSLPIQSHHSLNSIPSLGPPRVEQTLPSFYSRDYGRYLPYSRLAHSLPSLTMHSVSARSGTESLGIETSSRSCFLLLYGFIDPCQQCYI